MRTAYQKKKMKLFKDIERLSLKNKKRSVLLTKFNIMVSKHQENNMLYGLDCETCEDNGWVLEGIHDNYIKRHCPDCQLEL